MTLENERQDLVDNIVKNTNWKFFDDVEIKENGNLYMLYQFKHLDELQRLKLTPKYINHFLSCKYAYILLSYTTLMSYFFKACSDERFNKIFIPYCISKLYERTTNNFTSTYFIYKVLIFLNTLDESNSSFLILPLKKFYSISKSKQLKKQFLEIKQKSYLIKSGTELDFGQIFLPFSTLNNDLDYVFKQFCSKIQNPLIPKYQNMIDEYKIIVEPMLFYKYFDKKIQDFLIDSQRNYCQNQAFPDDDFIESLIDDETLSLHIKR
ncbi:uncharacterized protein LOC126901415 isoform X2 [Daktulosphaira vitifoliae]|nr:uncharacterized protein LOC126901415 isoform X2 [Daktulosphaira vitifoliae]